MDSWQRSQTPAASFNVQSPNRRKQTIGDVGIIYSSNLLIITMPSQWFFDKSTHTHTPNIGRHLSTLCLCWMCCVIESWFDAMNFSDMCSTMSVKETWGWARKWAHGRQWRCPDFVELCTKVFCHCFNRCQCVWMSLMLEDVSLCADGCCSLFTAFMKPCSMTQKRKCFDSITVIVPHTAYALRMREMKEKIGGKSERDGGTSNSQISN